MTTPLERLQTGYYNSNPVSVANPGGLDDDGHVANFPAALSDAAAVAVLAAGSASEAGGYKDEAAASAQDALNAVVANGTSNSTIVYGGGSKAVTLIETGLPFAKGQDVKLFRRAAPTTTAMWGTITDVTGLVVTVDVPAGNFLGAGGGSFSDWGLTTAGRPVAGTIAGALNWAATATLASAATVNIGAAASNMIDVSGTTTITAFDVIAAGAEREVRFTGVLTLTHNAASLILPGGANVLTAANDVAVFRSLGTGNWLCTAYTRANGEPLSAPRPATLATASVTLTAASTYLQQANMTLRGQGFTLPNATTLLTGPRFEFVNRGMFDLPIRDFAGNIEGFVAPRRSIKVNLLDSSTSAGVWSMDDARIVAETAFYLGSSIGDGPATHSLPMFLRLDADRDLIILPASGGVRAIVHNRTTGQFGAMTTVNALAAPNCRAVMISASSVLVISKATGSDTVEARVLSIAALVITVNAAVTKAFETSSVVYELVAVGTGFVCFYIGGVGPALSRAVGLSVSGTTPTWGTSVSLGAEVTDLDQIQAYVVGSTAVVFRAIGNLLSANALTISGATLTLGAAVTTAIDNNEIPRIELLTTGRFLAVVKNSSALAGVLFSISGTTITVSAQVTCGIATSGSGKENTSLYALTGGKAVVCGGAGAALLANVFTDTAGTLTAGSALNAGTFTAGFVRSVRYSLVSAVATFVKMTSDDELVVLQVDCAGASPTLLNLASHRFSDAQNLSGSLNSDYRMNSDGNPRFFERLMGSNGMLLPWGQNGKAGALLTPAPRRFAYDGVPGAAYNYKGVGFNEAWRMDFSSTRSFIMSKVETTP